MKYPKLIAQLPYSAPWPKVLTFIVSKNLTMATEQNQLLPETHFRGRPCRSTTDAVHLIHQIKEAWRKGKVVSILFLDIKGAFPNAVTD